MHELPVTKSILGIVLRHAESNGVQKVVSIQLSIGALSDLEEEWLQSYFDHLSRGTVAEGAKLQVRRSNLTFFCRQCSLEFSVPREDLDNTQCPNCGGKDATVVSGTGYSVESMEAQ
jgi:hydrogenase nickel incorporation protein HypA/HybF